MRIAVLSDARYPTSQSFPGHGLGKVSLWAAEGLQARGHEVKLFAHPLSSSKVEIQPYTDEAALLAHPEAFQGYDVVLDGTHLHKLQYTPGGEHINIVNWSHDRESKPGRNAIYPSKAHQRTMGGGGVVVPHGVPLSDISEEPEDYLLYVGTFEREKGPNMAAHIARLAGRELVMAGPTPPMYPVGPHVEYVGPVSGDNKLRLMSRAAALLFPASTESAGLTPLEAQSVGCPVMVTPWGAAREQIAPGDTGVIVETTASAVRYVEPLVSMSRLACRNWVKHKRSADGMTKNLEYFLSKAAKGETW